jgi:tol-pal system beta propeller repeat protein TolB
VHAVRPDGSARRVLAASPVDAFYPAAPAGERLLAVRVSGGDSPERHREELIALEPGGSTRAILAAGRIRNPSPGAAWVALESDRESFRDLYRVPLGGGGAVRLTESAHGNFEPAVSPDGRRIAFTSSRDGDAEIYVMDARGGRETRLTAFHRDDWSPTWTPDGGSIAFLSAREGRARVFVMRPDGTEQRRLLADWDEEVEEEEPVFSPDGRRLALVVRRADGGGEVWAADPRMGRRWPVSRAGARDSNPAWSPDGRYLVFASESDGQSDLFAARADGGGRPIRVTADPAPEWLPRWTRAEWPVTSRGAASAAPASSGSR